jgi:hypothetical protein
MAKELEAQGNRSPTLARKAGAAVILLIAGAIVVKFVIGILATIVLIAAALAVLWALKTIIW